MKTKAGAARTSRAVITVFFTLLCAAFIGFAFILIESVRFQGARAQAAAVADMGNYSVFGEYEKKLLTDFDVFAVDGAYGSSDFAIGRVRDKYRSYMQLNADPAAEGLSSLCFDPWKLSLQDAKITEYALLSDQNGEPFYQQVVGYMRKTAIMGVAGRLITWYREAKDAEKDQKAYQEEKNSLDKELEELEKAEKEKKKEQEENKEGESETETSLVPAGEASEPKIKIENPIPALKKLRKKSLLAITCGSRTISEGSVSRKDLASKRRLKKGTMKLKRKYGGLLDNLIFAEYLLDRFQCFTDGQREGKLQYELEYVLGGRTSDRKNLKYAIRQVLLIRETVNYFYSSGDAGMSAQAGALASLLIGWTGIPALVALMKHTLLLGWSYAESLLDVRGLMEGKRIAIWKDASTWKLSLENLAKINEILDKGGSGQKEGLTYKGYLRILLYLQRITVQKRRALDLVELRVKEGNGLSSFRVDHGVVGVKEQTVWSIPPVFSGAAGVFSGVMGNALQTQVASGFVYD